MDFNLRRALRNASLTGVVALSLVGSGCVPFRNAEVYLLGKPLNNNAKRSEDIRVVKEEVGLAPSVSMNSEYKAVDKRISYGVVESSFYSGNSRESVNLSDMHNENRIAPFFLLRKTW